MPIVQQLVIFLSAVRGPAFNLYCVMVRVRVVLKRTVVGD